MSKIPPMPPVVDRRVYDEEVYPGYLESNRDWAENNNEVIEWLADNHAAIRSALEALPFAWISKFEAGEIAMPASSNRMVTLWRQSTDKHGNELIPLYVHIAKPAVNDSDTLENKETAIDELAYRFWSIHPKELDSMKESMPKGYKGGVRAWYFATEIRKLLSTKGK